MKTSLLFIAAMSAVAMAACSSGPTSSGSSNDTAAYGGDDAGLAGEGESCGGFVANPVQCEPGLSCIYTIPDVPGVCTSVPAQIGEQCGGFVAHPKQCAAGLNCVANGTPDLPGTCEQPCGGNIFNPPPACPDGYRCIQSNPDATGYCAIQDPPSDSN